MQSSATNSLMGLANFLGIHNSFFFFFKKHQSQLWQHHGQASRGVADTLPPLKASVVLLADLDNDKIGIHLPEDNNNMLALLPPNFTILNAMGTEPASIDEALWGPNAKERKAVLDYKIEKLSTQVLEDPLEEEPVIPEVLKEKHRPAGEIKSYRVWIVARRHKQVKGINYTGTFLAAVQ